jgi:hypothetical protein
MPRRAERQLKAVVPGGIGEAHLVPKTSRPCGPVVGTQRFDQTDGKLAQGAEMFNFNSLRGDLR